MSKVKICAAHSDRGNPSFGNQSDELSQTNWYSHPWTHVIRCKDGSKASIMAEAMFWFCEETKLVGYSQTNGRDTLYREVKKLGRKNYKDLKTKVNTDCCALVDVCLYIAGYDVGQPATGNLLGQLNSKFPNDFKIFKSSEYTHSESKLQIGDILLNTATHAAMVTNGNKNTSTNSQSSGSSVGSVISNVPPKAVSVVNSDYAKSITSALGSNKYVVDFNKIDDLLQKDKNLKKTIQSSLSTLKQKVEKGDKYTSKIKNDEGITIKFLLEIYDDYLKLLNSYSPTTTNLKNGKKNLVDDFNLKITILELKQDSLKNSKNIYETDAWQKLISEAVGDSNINNYQTSLNDVEGQISELVSKFTEKTNVQLEEINNCQKIIDDYNNIINNESKEYTILNNQCDELYKRTQNINNNLLYNFENNFSNDYKYWDQNIIEKPNCLNFWFDFLDTDGELKEFSVPLVGTRDKSEDKGVECVYYKNVPQLIYYNSEDNAVDFSKTGYTYIPVLDNFLDQFSKSGRGISAKEKVDELLYNYGYCIEEISLTTVPIYYLEPNTRVFVYDEETSIEGEYLVDKISIPLAYNGTMNVSATKAPERLY